MDSREVQPQSHQPPPGMMVGPPNSYAHNLSNNASPMISPNSATNNTMVQNPSFPFNSAAPSASKQIDSGNSGYGFSIEPAKKKRGRPRKYSPEGNIALGLAPTPAPVTPMSSMGHGDSGIGTASSEGATKRSRGRPPGSGKKQLDALGSSGVGFTPHVILVNAGEDIAAKIVAFAQQGPRTVCILSANGAICNVTLRQPASGVVTYEGRFEIISLSGSFSLSEDNGNQRRTGGLSVSLAGSDNRVLGGGVAGMLLAASPVQVIVGSFIAEGKKSKTAVSPAPPPPQPTNMLNFGAAPVTEASPSSEDGGGSSDSSDENGSSPFNRGPAMYNNTSQPIHSMPMYSNMAWPNSTVKMN